MRINPISQTNYNKKQSSKSQSFGAITKEAAEFAIKTIGKNAESLGHFLVTAKRAKTNTRIHVHYHDNYLGLLPEGKSFERRYGVCNANQSTRATWLEHYTNLVSEAESKARVEAEVEDLGAQIMAEAVQVTTK